MRLELKLDQNFISSFISGPKFHNHTNWNWTKSRIYHVIAIFLPLSFNHECHVINCTFGTNPNYSNRHYWSTFISNLDQNYKFEQVQDNTKAYSNHVIINFGYVSGPKFTYNSLPGQKSFPTYNRRRSYQRIVIFESFLPIVSFFLLRHRSFTSGASVFDIFQR